MKYCFMPESLFQIDWQLNIMKACCKSKACFRLFYKRDNFLLSILVYQWVVLCCDIVPSAFFWGGWYYNVSSVGSNVIYVKPFFICMHCNKWYEMFLFLCVKQCILFVFLLTFLNSKRFVCNGTVEWTHLHKRKIKPFCSNTHFVFSNGYEDTFAF